MQRTYFPVVPGFTAPAGDQIPIDHAYDPVQIAQHLNWSRRAQGIGQSDSLAGAFARAAVKGVRIQTQISPEIYWTPTGGSQTKGGVGEWFLRTVVKPRVVIDTPAGPMVVAPYGNPNANYFPLIATGMVVGAGALVMLMWRGISRK